MGVSQKSSESLISRFNWEAKLLKGIAVPNVKTALRKYWRARTDAIYNVFNVDCKNRRRVCIAYMTLPYRMDSSSLKFHNHPNLWQCLEIGKVFHELGFVVDAVNRTSEQYIPRFKYDVFLNDTCSMLDSVIGYLPKSCIKIGYFLGQHWLDNNTSEFERLREVRRRNGHVLRPHRIWTPFYSDSHLDGAILIGNQVMLESYCHLTCPLYQVPVSVWEGLFFTGERYWRTAKKTFLWLGSGGAVHKGLDLVLDAFRELPEFKLHVVGPLSEDFRAAYDSSLNHSDNIAYHGFVDVASNEFNLIALECCGLVFPSCAEGTGSCNLVAMAKGLIPVISRECALDIGDTGTIVDSSSVESLRGAVKGLAASPDEKLQRLSTNAQSFCKEAHSRTGFSKAIRGAISALVPS